MPGPTPHDPDAPPPQLQLGGGRGLRIAIAVIGVLLLLGVAVAGGLILFAGDDEQTADQGSSDSTSPSETGTSAPESSLEVPTIDASDFPSDAPTTTLPTKPELPPVVSDLPTGLITDLPSQLPTDPEDLESWFSEQVEQQERP